MKIVEVEQYCNFCQPFILDNRILVNHLKYDNQKQDENVYLHLYDPITEKFVTPETVYLYRDNHTTKTFNEINFRRVAGPTMFPELITNVKYPVLFTTQYRGYITGGVCPELAINPFTSEFVVVNDTECCKIYYQDSEKFIVGKFATVFLGLIDFNDTSFFRSMLSRFRNHIDVRSYQQYFAHSLANKLDDNSITIVQPEFGSPKTFQLPFRLGSVILHPTEPILYCHNQKQYVLIDLDV